MNRTQRTILAIFFILVIMFSALSICQNLGRPLRWDVTEDNRNTLSDGTRAILAKLDQTIKIKLYYSRTAALKAPDWIQALNNHYRFVRSLLEEYQVQAKGMIDLEIIDPRQYSQDEADAENRYQLSAIPLPGPEKGEIENFFFGLVVQTQLGAVQKIPFFDPRHQNLVEYEVSRAIDMAVTATRTKVGILSSLPVVGQDPYMAYMMRQQGRAPQQPWWIVQLLKQQYEVESVDTDADAIPDDINILLVIHPKDLPLKTQLAIDQFVLAGKRAMVFVDPFAEADRPQQNPQMMMPQPEHSQSSNLPELLKAWGLRMPADTYAADLALSGLRPWWRGRFAMQYQPVTQLNLEGKCLNDQSVITAYLGAMRVFFSGVLEEVPDRSDLITLTSLLRTTPAGSTVQAAPFEVQNPSGWMDMNREFLPGSKPVVMAYLARGTFTTAFPEGIPAEKSDADDDAADENEGKKDEAAGGRIMPKIRQGQHCAVMVVADVDCIYDINLVKADNFGRPYELTENVAFMQNAIEALGGSDELIAIRSRGNMERRFARVDRIEQQATEQTAKKEAEIKQKLEAIDKKQSESMKLKLEQGNLMLDLDAEKYQQAERERGRTYLELERQLRETRNARRERIEQMGDRIKMANLLTAPGIILLIAIGLGIYRNAKRRQYISHASDS
ncbi:MAG: Gldg family protein [Sedimentisphaerales bacterium]|nr:Gldg family protein [Sedimentisphaerales bacterium]